MYVTQQMKNWLKSQDVVSLQLSLQADYGAPVNALIQEELQTRLRNAE